MAFVVIKKPEYSRHWTVGRECWGLIKQVAYNNTTDIALMAGGVSKYNTGLCAVAKASVNGFSSPIAPVTWESFGWKK